MPITIRTDFEQYTPEYWEAHRGLPSASNFSSIITAKKGDYSSASATYVNALIAEVLDQSPNFFTERPETVHMRNGINNEPDARRWYEFEKSCEVQQAGLVVNEDLAVPGGTFCCSPDGLVGTEGGLELKCPKLETHVGYLLAGGLPDEYKAQVHGSLIITGRPWWDFMSYAAGAPPLLVRVVPDAFTVKLGGFLEVFWLQYQKALEKVRSL